MFGILPLTPAYGRDYRSAKAVQEDFNKNSDFKCTDGRYINLVDIIDANTKEPGKFPDEIPVRYNKLQKVCMVNLPKAIKQREQLLRNLVVGEQRI